MKEISSALYVGSVTHTRLRPVRHRLRYSLPMVLLDLDELPALSRAVPGFAHNRAHLFSFHDRDHLAGSDETLRHQVDRLLAEAGIAAGGAIRILCMPRVLGFAFNPLSVFFCHTPDGALAAVLYEVNNTFGQRHSYLLPAAPGIDGMQSHHCAKRFYVSPFLEMDMTYHFRLAPPGDRAFISIEARDADGPVLSAHFSGSRRALTGANLTRVLVRYPLLALQVLGGIHWEALKLWGKGLRPVPRPHPPRRPGQPARIAEGAMSDAACETGWRAPRGLLAAMLGRMLRRLECGDLTVILADGQRLVARGSTEGPSGHIHLHRGRALRRLLTGGDIGFAEAYMDGDWSSPDLAALIEVAARNQSVLPGVEGGAWPSRLANRLYHRLRANSLAGSRRNIVSHYDLGNDFYASWLDPGMSYSSGLYKTPSDSLDAAQAAKQDRVLDLLSLRPGQSVLEIGIGWGGLAERLIRSGGLVAGVTLSPSQLSYAAARLRRGGLMADLHLRDYREIDGSYDRIVSIEMLEAVGEDWWPVYFAKLRGLLAPGGVAVLQTITIAEDRFASYRRGADFIQRHVFPGGMLPAPSVLRARIEEAGLAVEAVETFGESYALTLNAWRTRFDAAWPRIARQGFPPRFKRLWDYYLAYCEAGFRAGALDVGLWRLRPR